MPAPADDPADGPGPESTYPRDRRWFLLSGAVVAAAVACGRAGTDSAGTAGTDGTLPAAEPAPPTTSGAPATAGTSAAGATTSAPASSTTSTGKAGSSPTSSSNSPTTRAATTARFITNGDRGTRDVALTFHTNGDLGQVRSVLDIVEGRRLAITAFVVGNWLDANPSMGGRLVQGGHEVANHTYTHPTFEKLSAATMASEITKCRDVLARTTNGGGGTWFRLSGTDDGTAAPSAAAMKAAGDAGYRGVIGFDVDPFDYKDPGKQAVIDRTLAAAQPGSIISLHMGHPGTIEALPAILDGLQSRDLHPVTLSTLVG